MLQDILSDAAEQRVLQPRSPMRAHNDQVTVLLLGHPTDDLPGRAGVQMPFERNCRFDSVQLFLESLISRIGLIGQIECGWSIESVYDDQAGLRVECQFFGISKSVFGWLGKIEGT